MWMSNLRAFFCHLVLLRRVDLERQGGLRLRIHLHDSGIGYFYLRITTKKTKINKRGELSDHDIKGLVKQREEESA